MADASSFTKMVPGFDFLQSLVKNAGAAIPGIGQWVAPTLDPAELEKRIGELRTVQFWLEQNARMLATTIQALEVQKMTLSTLKTMNVQMGDLRESLKLKPPADAAPGAAPAKKAAPRASKAEPGARRRGRPDAVVGRAHQPVRPARDHGDEGQRHRRGQDARRQHAQAVVRQRRRRLQGGDERAGQGGHRRRRGRARRRPPAPARRWRGRRRRRSAAPPPRPSGRASSTRRSLR